MYCTRYSESGGSSFIAFSTAPVTNARARADTPAASTTFSCSDPGAGVSGAGDVRCPPALSGAGVVDAVCDRSRASTHARAACACHDDAMLAAGAAAPSLVAVQARTCTTAAAPPRPRLQRRTARTPRPRHRRDTRRPVGAGEQPGDLWRCLRRRASRAPPARSPRARRRAPLAAATPPPRPSASQCTGTRGSASRPGCRPLLLSLRRPGAPAATALVAAGRHAGGARGNRQRVRTAPRRSRPPRRCSAGARPAQSARRKTPGPRRVHARPATTGNTMCTDSNAHTRICRRSIHKFARAESLSLLT